MLDTEIIFQIKNITIELFIVLFSGIWMQHRIVFSGVIKIYWQSYACYSVCYFKLFYNRNSQFLSRNYY